MTEFHTLRSLEDDCKSKLLVHDDDDTNVTDQENNRMSLHEWNQLNVIATQRAVDSSKHTNNSTVLSSLVSHISYKDYTANNVYEPSDDTYLLCDALQYHIPIWFKQQHQQLHHVVEIGCGSGLNISYLHHLLHQQQQQQQIQKDEDNLNSTSTTFEYHCTDMNALALQFTKQTFLNSTKSSQEQVLHLYECDLASTVLEKLKPHSVSILIFNPPYVPTPDTEVVEFEVKSNKATTTTVDAACCWAGGERGRRVLDRAIPQIVELLHPIHGIAYIVTVDENDPHEIATSSSFCMTPVFRRKCYNEYLTIHTITINKQTTKQVLNK